MLVSRYKLYLCHTPIKPDLLGFPGISVFTCALRDHEVCIIWYQSLAPLIRLYPSEICVSYYFRKNTLVSNFFFSLNLRHIKKLLFHFVTVQNISVASKKREKREGKKKNKSFKKIFIGFRRRKLNKEKLDQINSKLAQIWYSNYWGPILGSIGYRFLLFSISGLIRSDP